MMFSFCLPFMQKWYYR